MSTTKTSNKTLSNSLISQKNAVEITKKVLLQGPESGENCLVQPPPTVHPEQIIPELVDNHDLYIVFIAPTAAQLNQMEKDCRALNLSTRKINSGYEKCTTYLGEHGEKVKKDLKSLMEDVPLGLLHKNENLPCCPNCPYLKWNRPDFTERVILANPRHAYIDTLLEGRVVFTCSLRGDAYIKKIGNPSSALDSYLDKNTGFNNYEDFIQNRNSNDAPSIWDFLYGTIDPSTDDEEFGYAIDEDGHHLAPKIFFGLLYAEKLNNGWETSFHHRKDSYGNYLPTNRPLGGGDPFAVAGIDYFRDRVVRRPGKTPTDDEIYLLDIPNFTKAKCVVAFDIAPTPWMWQLYYGTNFDYKRVYSDNETADFLRNEMNLKVVQTAKSRKPYDGKNVTPGRDASIAVWVTAEFGRSPTVVSTKKALDRYRSEQSEILDVDAKDGIQYRNGGSVITDKEPLVILNGTPRPQNEEFQLWGALEGKSVPHTSNQQPSFGKIGDEVRHQFCESRVAKWATRFNRRNGTVILNTTAVPEWLKDGRLVTHESPTKVLPDNARGQRAIARYLREKNGTNVAMKDIQSVTGVSGNTARRARDSFIDQGWITKHITDGRQPDEYSWSS